MKLNPVILPALAFALALILPVPFAHAQVAGAPTFVDYQGTVFDGNSGKPLGSDKGNPKPTNYTMRFKIFDGQSADAKLIWAETQTVTVSLGAFSVRLGSGASIAGLDPAPQVASIANAFNGKERYLELTVIIPPATTGTPITPRLAFQSSPFSFVAQRAKLADEVNGKVTAAPGSTFSGTVSGTVSGNGSGLTNLNGSNLNNGTVTAAKLGADVGKWSVSGPNVYRSGGNVGIGTSNPTSPLSFANRDGPKIAYWYSADNNNRLYGVDLAGGGLVRHWAGVFGATLFGNSNTSDGFVERMRIDNAGRVGIGTTNPRASLEVKGRGGSIFAPGSFAKLSWDGQGNPIGGGFPDTASSLTIISEGAVLAGAHWLISDARIKNIQGRSDPAKDLHTLLGIEITDYRYKDRFGRGNAPHKKIIAQQVEKTFPQAVSKTTDVVPDIYKRASFERGWVDLATNLKPGERVKLVGDKVDGIYEVLEVKKGKFRTSFESEGDKVFVYGREVDDFRIVDYEAIAMLNVSATQQIKKEMDAEVKALQEENASLRSRLKALEAREQERDAKLAALEKLLPSTETADARAVSLKADKGAR